MLAGLLLDPHHDAAIHLQEPAVAVPGEFGVVRPGRQHLGHLVIDPEIQNRIHHARHRVAGPGAHREEQGVRQIAELLAHRLLDLGEIGLDLGHQGGGILPLVRVVIGANLGGDGESGRNRQADAAHFREVRALPSEQGAPGGIAIRLAATKEVDVLALAFRGGFPGRLSGRLLCCLADRLGGGFAGRLAGGLTFYDCHSSCLVSVFVGGSATGKTGSLWRKGANLINGFRPVNSHPPPKKHSSKP
ncbi:hypothetical protein ES703_69090 [subsurface metagenome]